MAHPLEEKYGLTAQELLDALDRRFRAKVTLEGVVAEVHLGRKLKALEEKRAIARFEGYDEDGKPDYAVWLRGRAEPLLIECKNVRNSNEAYRSAGEIVAYKVEVQKTRASKGDITSRFYDASGYFDVLAVCLGKKTGDWSQFMFLRCCDLTPHRKHSGKIGVMHRVPLPGSEKPEPWSHDLLTILQKV